MANEAELRRIVSLIDASPLEKRDPKDLLPYAQNSRTHSEYQIKQIADSIIEFGFTNPVLIDEKDEVIAGHGRIFAAMKLELPKVPVIVMSHLSPTQKKAYVIADNKLALNAGWDLDLLKLQLNELDNEQFDLTLTGFDDTELDTLLGEVIPANEGNTDPDAIPEVKETRCKPGDLWQLGNHRVLCGDSTNIQHVERLMGGEKADMVFTDPPYNQPESGGKNDSIGKAVHKQTASIAHLIDFDPKTFLNVLPTLFAKSLNAYVFTSKDLLPDYLQWAKSAGYAFNVLVWKKPNAIPIGGTYRPDVEYLLVFRKSGIFNSGLSDVSYSKVIECKRDASGLHPTMKPVEIIENQLRIGSNQNSVVVDSFLGSGSTLIACEKTGRKCYGMEIDPHYCGVILARWEQFTGQTAVLVEEPNHG